METILYGDGLQHDKIAQDFKSRYSALGSQGHKGFKKQKYIFYFILYTIQCVAYYCKTRMHTLYKKAHSNFLDPAYLHFIFMKIFPICVGITSF